MYYNDIRSGRRAPSLQMYMISLALLHEKHACTGRAVIPDATGQQKVT
jgi:hypothetical protein